MTSQHVIATPVINYDDVISHEAPPSGARILQPLPTLTEEEKRALYSICGHLPYVWDENGVLYLSVLSESAAFADSPAMLKAWSERWGAAAASH